MDKLLVLCRLRINKEEVSVEALNMTYINKPCNRDIPDKDTHSPAGKDTLDEYF